MDLEEDTLVSRKHGADGLKNSFNPGGQIKYIVARIVSLFMDPFFFYIPFLSHNKMCVGINTNLWKLASIFRSVADFVVFIGCFRFTAQILLNSSRRSILTLLILFFYCLALAPFPQVLFSESLILKTLRGYMFPILFVQYVARLALIFRSCGQFKKRVSFTTRIWVNTLVCVFLYINATHVIGASWYYLSIKQQVSCWHHACKIDDGCVDSIFHCDDGITTSTLNSTLVNEFCPLNPLNSTVFDYGIFFEAFQSGIVEDKGVLEKFVRCIFWGLRILSSFASDLQTSTDVDDETAFLRIIISAVALILLTYVIEYIMSVRDEKSKRVGEKMKPITESLKDLGILETSILNPKKLKIQGKAEKWLSDNNIPPSRNNILFYLTSGLKDDEAVNLRSVLSVLPHESKWMTMKDLCFDTLKKVPGLQNIDEEWFRSVSRQLQPVNYPKESYIFREGEPLDCIIFITNGIAWSYTTSTNAGGKVTVSSKSLEKGDFFGEELLQWKLDRRRELKSERIPLTCVPISTASVKSHTQVEALVLMTKDLALCSDFPVATSKLRRIIKKRMILKCISTQKNCRFSD